jgi:hypothetical protein
VAAAVVAAAIKPGTAKQHWFVPQLNPPTATLARAGVGSATTASTAMRFASVAATTSGTASVVAMAACSPDNHDIV